VARADEVRGGGLGVDGEADGAGALASGDAGAEVRGGARPSMETVKGVPRKVLLTAGLGGGGQGGRSRPR
jgi:hypothetical protein